MHRPRLLVQLAVSAVAVTVTMVTSAAAQSPGALPVERGTCSYARCALSIAPTWNGLALARGTSATRVANLGFFWVRPIDRALTGQDSAAWYGARAVRVGRGAAVLTDAGGLLLGYALGRRLARGTFPRDAQMAGGAGVAAIAMSVPLHFAADGNLSRAVWWYNLQFGR